MFRCAVCAEPDWVRITVDVHALALHPKAIKPNQADPPPSAPAQPPSQAREESASILYSTAAHSQAVKVRLASSTQVTRERKVNDSEDMAEEQMDNIEPGVYILSFER